jgi:hypothetical protein
MIDLRRPSEILDEDYDFEDFLRQYAETALWSSSNDRFEEDEGASEMLDGDYGVEDIAPETMAEMRRECRDFWEANAADIVAYAVARGDVEYAGHDFWLTRNGHGAGFWDRGLGELGDRLTAASKPYAETYLCVGDDGQVWGQ